MKKLLAVITRMYAERGGDRDEFVESWGGQKTEEFIVFPREPSSFDRAMLLIHGYGYPRVASEASISRAGKSIVSGLEAKELPTNDCEIGLLFHPPLSWGATAKDSFAENVLNSTEKLTFVREYRQASQLIKSLAPKCKHGADFSDDFDNIWNEYRSNLTRYDTRFGLLLTDMDACVGPLMTQLDIWRKDGFEDESDAKFSQFYTASVSAFDKAMGNKGILVAVDHIVNTLILETRSEKKLGEIDQKFQEVREFLSGQTQFNAVRETLNLLKPTEPRSAVGRDELRSKLTTGNPIREWYSQLIALMQDLRRALSKKDE